MLKCKGLSGVDEFERDETKRDIGLHLMYMSARF